MNRNALSAATCAIALLASTTGVSGELTLASSTLLGKVPELNLEAPSYHYYTLGQYAFQPTEDGPYQLGFTAVGAFAMNSATLAAPVQLPDKAVVNQMTCYLFDEDYERDIKCQLVKFRLDDGEAFYVDESRTEATDYGAVKTVVSTNEEINNLDYAYAIWASPAERDMGWPDDGPNMGIKGITLRYLPAE